jgi:hydrogenase maturation protein HypF
VAVAPSAQAGSRIHITGVVQGVGFRPFVYGLALRYGLAGWVRNTSAGVDIEVDGSPAARWRRLPRRCAPKRRPWRASTAGGKERTPDGFSRFEIVHSAPVAGAFQPISPDVSHLRRLPPRAVRPGRPPLPLPLHQLHQLRPALHHHPRHPLRPPADDDGPLPLCDACAAEYNDPAQPPLPRPAGGLSRVRAAGLAGGGSGIGDRGSATSPIPRWPESRSACPRLLREGKILAVKGLGGFHLACDATLSEAVSELRGASCASTSPLP